MLGMLGYPLGMTHPGCDFWQEMETALRAQEDVFWSHVDMAALNEVLLQPEITAPDEFPCSSIKFQLILYRSQA